MKADDKLIRAGEIAAQQWTVAIEQHKKSSAEARAQIRPMALGLYAARRLYPAKRTFGAWLKDSLYNKVPKDDRAALITIGELDDKLWKIKELDKTLCTPRGVLGDYEKQTISQLRNQGGENEAKPKPEVKPKPKPEDEAKPKPDPKPKPVWPAWKDAKNPEEALQDHPDREVILKANPNISLGEAQDVMDLYAKDKEAGAPRKPLRPNQVPLIMIEARFVSARACADALVQQVQYLAKNLPSAFSKTDAAEHWMALRESSMKALAIANAEIAKIPAGVRRSGMMEVNAEEANPGEDNVLRFGKKEE